MSTDDQWKGLGQIYKEAYFFPKYPIRAELYSDFVCHFYLNAPFLVHSSKQLIVVQKILR